VRAVLIANGGDNDGGVVVERFRELGWDFASWAREDAPAWDALPNDVGLVISLGSDWSVYWDDIAPNVAAEAALLRLAHGRRVPIFGICFGGQMLAHALGGSVERATAPEIGWFPVDCDENLAQFRQQVWFQWHYDRFTPPPGAAELGVGAQGSQAFMVGSSLGLQFHPEVTPKIVRRWSQGPGEVELARVGIDAHQLCSDTESHAHMSRDAGRRLVDWFVSRAMH
jgi:GMP synthase-like glutamine amidotransferase